MKGFNAIDTSSELQAEQLGSLKLIVMELAL